MLCHCILQQMCGPQVLHAGRLPSPLIAAVYTRRYISSDFDQEQEDLQWDFPEEQELAALDTIFLHRQRILEKNNPDADDTTFDDDESEPWFAPSEEAGSTPEKIGAWNKLRYVVEKLVCFVAQNVSSLLTHRGLGLFYGLFSLKSGSKSAAAWTARVAAEPAANNGAFGSV